MKALRHYTRPEAIRATGGTAMQLDHSLLCLSVGPGAPNGSPTSQSAPAGMAWGAHPAESGLATGTRRCHRAAPGAHCFGHLARHLFDVMSKVRHERWPLRRG